MGKFFKLKSKNLVFTILILLFTYQNCSQKDFSTPATQQAQQFTQKNLSDLQVQQIKFFTEKESELQKGAHKFYVKTKVLYSLDLESGVLAEHDQAAESFQTYCLTSDLLNDIRGIVSTSSVCQQGQAVAEGMTCSQVIVEPYAEIVTNSESISLGYASDACGSNPAY
jgi:hypothetical protein